MGIEDLNNLIKARERQMGKPMLDLEETVVKEKKSEEVTEIMKLLFTYIKETTSSINSEIIKIREQQEKILNILEKKDKE